MPISKLGLYVLRLASVTLVGLALLYPLAASAEDPNDPQPGGLQPAIPPGSPGVPLSEEDELVPDSNFGFNPPPPAPTDDGNNNNNFNPPPGNPPAMAQPSTPSPTRNTPGGGRSVVRPDTKTTAAKPTATAKPQQKLADYLELDSSVKGLEVKNFDLPDKDIKDVVTLISKWTGKNFILDNKVRGKITIIGPSQVTLQEAYNAFLSALEANGLTTVQSGKFIRIIESAEARRAPVKTYAGDFAPKDDQFITRIFQLKYINADEVQREFRDLTTRQGKLFAYEPTNSIIITDTGSNIQRIREILDTLDVKSFETTLHVLHIKNSSAKTISDMLGEIYGDDKKGASGAARTFRRSALERTRGGGVISKIIPDEQTNSLIVLANQAGFVQLQALVGRLDVKVTDTGKIHVYYCEYAKAEDLAATLAALSGGGSGKSGTSGSRRTTTTSPNTPATPGGTTTGLGSSGPVTAELDGGVKITSDNSTNSLVITANASDYKTLKRVIKKLDIPRLQVFVETAIVELTVDDNTNIGVNVATGGPGNAFHGGFIGDATSIAGFIAGTTPSAGLTLPAFAGPSFSANLNGSQVTSFTFMGLLNLLTKNTESSILSTPQIIALDNEKAEFKVQDEIPTASSVTAATATSGQIQNITPLKTGIEVKLTPHVNAASRTIRMEIEQTVDSLRDDSLTPEILQKTNKSKTSRSTNTSVVVRDADYIMMGGLMTDSVNDAVTKVPLLGDIPILGWLFKSKNRIVAKKNLVILLHPRIIGTTLASANLVKEKLDIRDRFLKKYTKDEDQHKDWIDDIKAKVKQQRRRGEEAPIFDYRNNEGEDEDPTPRPGEQSQLDQKSKRNAVTGKPPGQELKNLPQPTNPPQNTAGSPPAGIEEEPLLEVPQQ